MSGCSCCWGPGLDLRRYGGLREDGYARTEGIRGKGRMVMRGDMGVKAL